MTKLTWSGTDRFADLAVRYADACGRISRAPVGIFGYGCGFLGMKCFECRRYSGLHRWGVGFEANTLVLHFFHRREDINFTERVRRLI